MTRRGWSGVQPREVQRAARHIERLNVSAPIVPEDIPPRQD